MKIKKTWATVHFIEGDIEIEATLNYETKSFYLSHGCNDRNVTYKSDGKNSRVDLDAAIVRNKCVSSALIYIKKELSF